MVKYVLGIDPGKNGALVLLSNEGAVCDMTVMLDPYDISRWLEVMKNRGIKFMTVIEKAQAMPRNSPKAMFTYGQGYGELLGMLMTLKLPFTCIAPAIWTKVMHKGVDAKLKAKEKSLLVCQRLYPTVNLIIGRERVNSVPHDGIVDALLIATYGLRTYNI